jgi:predicted aspartyl protease
VLGYRCAREANRGERDRDGPEYRHAPGRKPRQPDVTEGVAFLIDSGAIYSIVPSAVLERLGITPLAAEQFHLADGTTITRKKGIALFRYGDRVGGADAIFGEGEDSSLFGVTTLEALGLSLDPIQRQLRPVPLVLAAF